MRIKSVEYGLANRFDDRIEINKSLFDRHDLFIPILEHELSHTNKKGFSWKDFEIDLVPSKINHIKLFFFMLKHPKTFTQLSPLIKSNGKLYYDLNNFILWCVVLLFSYLYLNKFLTYF